MPEKAPNNQAKKHLKEILLLFSVPLGVIALIIGFIYIPRLLADPTHDFVYCEGYYCDNKFSVNSNGKLTTSSETDRFSYRDYQLYYYDATRDATRPIQAADAENYLLDPTSKSPEGYTLERNTNSGGFLFWSESGGRWSLEKGIVSKPIDINGYDIKFVGWVL